MEQITIETTVNAPVEKFGIILINQNILLNGTLPTKVGFALLLKMTLELVENSITEWKQEMEVLDLILKELMMRSFLSS